MGSFDAEGNYIPRVIIEDNLVGQDLANLVGNSVLEFDDGDLVTGTVVKIDRDGADGGGRRLIRWDLKTGKGTTLVDRYDGHRPAERG